MTTHNANCPVADVEDEESSRVWLHVRLIPAFHLTLHFSATKSLISLCPELPWRTSVISQSGDIPIDLINIVHTCGGCFVSHDHRTNPIAKFVLSRCSCGLQTPVITQILEDQGLHQICSNQWIHLPPLISPTEQIQTPRPAMGSHCRLHGSRSTRNP